MIISGIDSISETFSSGTKNIVHHCLIAVSTEGSNHCTFFIDQSSHNSQKKTPFSIISKVVSDSCEITLYIATAMGTSNLVPIFLMSDGARFITIFLGGRSIPQCLNVALILSFDSLIAASGSQIISIVGNDLFESTSILIRCH